MDAEPVEVILAQLALLHHYPRPLGTQYPALQAAVDVAVDDAAGGTLAFDINACASEAVHAAVLQDEG